VGQLQDASLESPPVACYRLCPGLSPLGGQMSAPGARLPVPVSVDPESVLCRMCSSLRNVPALFCCPECARRSRTFWWHCGGWSNLGDRPGSHSFISSVVSAEMVGKTKKTLKSHIVPNQRREKRSVRISYRNETHW